MNGRAQKERGKANFITRGAETERERERERNGGFIYRDREEERVPEKGGGERRNGTAAARFKRRRSIKSLIKGLRNQISLTR